MSNQSYLNVWCEDFSEDRILPQFRDFLATVPFSRTRPGFTHLVIRAVDPTEPPVLEQDLRRMPLDADGVIEMIRDQLHSDCSYEVRCHWDLTSLDPLAATSKIEPRPMEILCYGEDYDQGAWRENGHIQVNFGFEHFFTGHAGLLGIRHTARTPESPDEARFLEAMAWPENLEKYQEATRTNIRKLFDWVRTIEKAIPVERLRLWSEGEENFEARLEEILAAR
jgi:hypothetical protein